MSNQYQYHSSIIQVNFFNFLFGYKEPLKVIAWWGLRDSLHSNRSKTQTTSNKIQTVTHHFKQALSYQFNHKSRFNQKKFNIQVAQTFNSSRGKFRSYALHFMSRRNIKRIDYNILNSTGAIIHLKEQQQEDLTEQLSNLNLDDSSMANNNAELIIDINILIEGIKDTIDENPMQGCMPSEVNATI